MSAVVLIRPGLTDFGEQKRIQGSLELPLNGRGQQQVDDLVEQIANLPIEVVFTDPCEPARSTAEAIAHGLGIPMTELKGLRNIHQGLWEGLQIDDVKRKYPKVFKQWQDAPASICPPEGESIEEAIERVRKTLKKPLKKRIPFAIVASEPLATLIGDLVRGKEPCPPGPKCVNNCDYEMVELLQDDEHLLTPLYNKDSGSNPELQPHVESKGAGR